jgi:hypothetical protein
MHNPRGRGSKKRRLLVMTEREGRVRTAPMPDGKVKTVKPIIHRAASRDAHLMTDGDRTMVAVGKTYRAHSAVNHSDKEYARDDAHINTAEAFNLFLRRAKIGVWHQWGENHQQRYVEQIQFHWDHRPKTRKVDGKRHRVSNETPIIERMQRLFAIGSGRQIRWTATKGIKEIEAPTPPQQPSAPQDVGRSL